MQNISKFLLLFLFSLTLNVVVSQEDSSIVYNDSLNTVLFDEYNKKLQETHSQLLEDSIKKAELEAQLNSLKTTDNLQKEELLKQLKSIEENQKLAVANKKARIDSLRKTVVGFPVIGAMRDTLFYVYSKIGASTPSERAASITNKINKLYDDDLMKVEDLIVINSENTFDIVYGDMIIMSISETDAIWYENSIEALANELKGLIQESIVKAREDNSFFKLILRIGLVLLVFVFGWLIIWFIGKGYTRLLNFVEAKKDVWLTSLSYKDYTFLSTDQELKIVLFAIKVFRWIVYAALLYFSLPILFSIFPFSRTWADALIHLVWSPFKNVLVSVWEYLPNLFSILVIYFVMRYFIKFVKYIFTEIEEEKLKLSGFHSDWASPTFSIVKFLLYAFMFVMIFPYLPGSDSNIFKGVSVFIGVLFSLGSSSAVANMVAGLVITYMRPFKIGDRIKIGDATGDVVEKTLLVTRIKTIKNEVITIPNSSVLSGNTTNYSSEAKETGLIVHTTITIGYDVPWKNIQQALLTAADRTKLVLKTPTPFVLQTSLEDFYVAYQINAYTKEASKQALIYSELHQNIQDVCNEMGIEILSPHYRAARDGNTTTIPADYLDKNYKSPSFKVKIEKEE